MHFEPPTQKFTSCRSLLAPCPTAKGKYRVNLKQGFHRVEGVFKFDLLLYIVRKLKRLGEV